VFPTIRGPSGALQGGMPRALEGDQTAGLQSERFVFRIGWDREE